MTENLHDRDIDADGVQSVYWNLEGSDCETCGWSPDEGAFHLWPDGKCYLSTQVGCYGGSYDEGRESVLQQVEYLARVDERYVPYVNEIKEILNDRD